MRLRRSTRWFLWAIPVFTLYVALGAAFLFFGLKYFTPSAEPKSSQAKTRKESSPTAAQTVWMTVTAYDLCPVCTEKEPHPNHTTALGDNARIFDGVAADFGLLPARTQIFIPGIGRKEVDDTGGDMRQAAESGAYHIDVRMETHEAALQFGRQRLPVTIFRRSTSRSGD